MKSINAPRYILALLIFLAGGMLTLSCEFELPEKEATFECKTPTLASFYGTDPITKNSTFNVTVTDLENITSFTVKFLYNGTIVSTIPDQNPKNVTTFTIPVAFRTGAYAVLIDYKNECGKSDATATIDQKIQEVACITPSALKSTFGVEGTQHFHYIDEITNVEDVKNFDVEWKVGDVILPESKKGITSLTGNARRANVSELTGKIEVKVTYYTECGTVIPLSDMAEIPANPCKINPTLKTEADSDGKNQYHVLTVDSLTNIKSFSVIWYLNNNKFKEVKDVTKLSTENRRTLVQGTGGDYKVEVNFVTNCGEKISKSNILPITVKPNLCDTIPVLGIGSFTIASNGHLIHTYSVFKTQGIEKYEVVIKNNGEKLTEEVVKYSNELNFKVDLTNRTGVLSIELKLTNTCGKDFSFVSLRQVPLHIAMTSVKGGSYTIGSLEGSSDAFPPPSPENIKDFKIGNYEVTIGQWNEVMGTQISRQWASPSEENTYRMMPVVNVSWVDCKDFIKALNALTGKSYRLPTEREWEYAAGGGALNRTRFGNGTDFLKLSEALFSPSSVIPPYSYGERGSAPAKPTHLLTSTRANALGLYNMSGNVSEICENLYTVNYLSNTTPAETVPYYVRRGGSFQEAAAFCTVSVRQRIPLYGPGDEDSRVGFRLAHD